MSLILEALKKSEQQRRLGELPTLSSPAPSRPRRRSALPWLAALIVVALAAGWWFTRDDAAPAVVGEPPMAAVPADETAAAADAAPTAPARERRATRSGARTAPPAAAPDTVHVADPAPGGDRPGAVVDLPPAGPVASAPTRLPPASTEVARAGNATAQPDTGAKAAMPSPADRSDTPAKERRTAAPGTPAKPAQPALPSVWELPYGVRRDLPAITLTMHVWSSVPAERFVVIDGERHVEGDELESGVVLHEISTDGLVLEFQGHRFTYPRDGR